MNNLKKTTKNIDNFIKFCYNRYLLFLHLSPTVFDYLSPKSHPDEHSASKVILPKIKETFSACR